MSKMKTVVMVTQNLHSPIKRNPDWEYESELQSKQPNKLDLEYEKTRLETFKSYPNKKLDFNLLAKTGLYYLGKDDEMRCYFCRKILKNVKEDDDVIEIHLKNSRNCPLITRRRTANKPINEIELDLALPPLMYDECGNGCRPFDMKYFRRRQHPEFVTYESRYASFKNWPSKCRQSPEDMADAGLFYTNESDKVKCYDCGIGLKDWEPEDIPWVEHAKWAKYCYYVDFIQDKEFIKAAKAGKPVKLTTDATVKSMDTDENVGGSMYKREVCRICSKNYSDVTLLPCNHSGFCKYCSVNLDECVICKQPVEGKVKFYYG